MSAAGYEWPKGFVRAWLSVISSSEPGAMVSCKPAISFRRHLRLGIREELARDPENMQFVGSYGSYQRLSEN